MKVILSIRQLFLPPIENKLPGGEITRTGLQKQQKKIKKN